MYYFTKEGLEKIHHNLEQLRKDYMENIKSIANERDNNLGESGSFLFSRTELSNRFVYEKGLYQEKIKNAVLIENTEEYKNWDGMTVIMKSDVTINFAGKEETYSILGEGEANPSEYIISYESDLAKALLGHKMGDIIPFRNSTITILNVKKIEKGKRLIKK